MPSEQIFTDMNRLVMDKSVFHKTSLLVKKVELSTILQFRGESCLIRVITYRNLEECYPLSLQFREV